MIDNADWLPVAPYAASTPIASVSAPSLSPHRMAPRQAMLRDIGHVIRCGGWRLDRTISNVLADIVAEPDLLDGLAITPSPQGYTRHLLESGPGYCVLAIAWLPGQKSPVHSHRAFCVLGVHRGTLTETHFGPVTHDEAAATPNRLRPTDCRQLHPGATSHDPGGDPHAHRVANLGAEPAVSIHVYGAAFDRLGTDMNEIWAD